MSSGLLTPRAMFLGLCKKCNRRNDYIGHGFEGLNQATYPNSTNNNISIKFFRNVVNENNRVIPNSGSKDSDVIRLSCLCKFIQAVETLTSERRQNR